jgi:hypothetical protein
MNRAANGARRLAAGLTVQSLPHRSVLVNPLATKKAVFHHAPAQQK